MARGAAGLPEQAYRSLSRNPDVLPEEVLGEYEPVGEDLLGEGAFAVVRLLRRRRTGELFALKCVEKHQLRIRNMLDQAQQEVQIHHDLHHPNILRLLRVFDDRAYLYMLLEYCALGSLRKVLAQAPGGRFEEPEAACYIEQIVKGVMWMHQHAYVHRDLKLENMLVTASSELKICDFGWSADIHIEKLLKTVCGTEAYWAPEMWEGAAQDESVDLWALGCMLYEMLAGHPPFFAPDQEELRNKVLAVQFMYPPWFSNEACHAVASLLQREPRLRLRCSDLLTHAWLRKHCCVGGGAVPSGAQSPLHPQGRTPPSLTRGSVARDISVEFGEGSTIGGGRGRQTSRQQMVSRQASTGSCCCDVVHRPGGGAKPIPVEVMQGSGPQAISRAASPPPPNGPRRVSPSSLREARTLVHGEFASKELQSPLGGRSTTPQGGRFRLVSPVFTDQKEQRRWAWPITFHRQEYAHAPAASPSTPPVPMSSRMVKAGGRETSPPARPLPWQVPRLASPGPMSSPAAWVSGHGIRSPAPQLPIGNTLPPPLMLPMASAVGPTLPPFGLAGVPAGMMSGLFPQPVPVPPAVGMQPRRQCSRGTSAVLRPSPPLLMPPHHSFMSGIGGCGYVDAVF